MARPWSRSVARKGPVQEGTDYAGSCTLQGGVSAMTLQGGVSAMILQGQAIGGVPAMTLQGGQVIV